MTFDGLLTALSLLAAVYAILPRSSRLNFRVWLGASERVAIWLVFALVNYCLLYPTLKAVGATPNLGLYRFGITPGVGSYALLVGTAVAVLVRARTASLSKRNIAAFGELCEE